jgi:hypothetical protein
MITDVKKLVAIINVLRKQIDVAFELLTPEQQAYFLTAIKTIGEPYKEEE